MYVLAVDDEQYALAELETELKKVFPNAEICAYRKANQAMEWVKELAHRGETLDYAFLDVQMRGINGLELAHFIKSAHPDAVLFFCTAYSEYAFDAFGLYAKGYILKPAQAHRIEKVLDQMVTDWRLTASRMPRDVRIQTFGHFEVFVEGTQMVFEREKAKELLAYLVDRRGSSVTTEQIAMILWEDEPYDRKLKNRTTTVISSLRNSLREAGIEDILVKSWNHLALDTAKVKCDAYDYEKWDIDAVNSFRGEYMVNYSWAEFTAGKYVRMEQDLYGRP